MILVVDTNRIVAALIKDSTSRRIIYSDKFILLTPAFAKAELGENENEILKKARITKRAFDSLLSLILSNLYVVDDSIIKYKFKEAQSIMDKIDPDDTPFMPLALAVGSDGIWSDDKHFQKQNKIKAWRTSDLIGYLS